MIRQLLNRLVREHILEDRPAWYEIRRRRARSRRLARILDLYYEIALQRAVERVAARRGDS